MVAMEAVPCTAAVAVPRAAEVCGQKHNIHEPHHRWHRPAAASTGGGGSGDATDALHAVGGRRKQPGNAGPLLSAAGI